jgi:ubiquinol-cytochrome c reductase cytochrome c subunit
MTRAEVYLLATGVVIGLAVFVVADNRAAASQTGHALTPAHARLVFARDCAVCHGTEGTGSRRGPSLVDVGAASADYEMSTGRMPLASPAAKPLRHAPAYSPALIRALTRIVAGFGSGPPIPHVALAGANVAPGGTVFRLNCAGCHQAVGSGGALINREAPALTQSTPTQVAEAVRTGPGQMPSFGIAALTTQQVANVAAFVQTLHHPNDRGGLSIWHLGPVPEGGIALVVGLGLAVLVTMWIGDREPRQETQQ